MLRRLLPTLVALGCGLLALVWGLVSLQRIFEQEREDGRALMNSRRDAVAHTAAEVLRLTLARQLAENITAIHEAIADPLAPDDGLFFRFRGQTVLPRSNTFRSDAPPRTAHETYFHLASRLGGHAPTGPWGPRLERLQAVKAALDDRDLGRAETSLEALLRYHSDNPLSPVEEIPFLLLTVEALERGPATMSLVRGLLHQGLPDNFEGLARSKGLQRDLLENRTAFTQADFEFLRGRIIQLSQCLYVPSERFIARASEPLKSLLPPPHTLKFDSPILLAEGWYLETRWYFERDSLGEEKSREKQIYGIFLTQEKLDDLLTTIAEDMRARGLFEPDDRLRLELLSKVQPLSTLRLAVDMPQWARAEADLEARYGLKTALVAVCGFLAVSIFALSLVSQQRKYRYLELKSDFVATVSHELRTPLASIRLLGETLERKLSQLPDIRDYPARIVQAADGLHFLVENILSFNRIDKGRWKLRTSRVRLEELVNPLRDDLAAATTVPVELHTDLGDAELEGDPYLLRLLFSNLGRNACAYNRRSPVVISIAAQVVPGQFCTVLFRDNGIGIPPDEWENVFQEFYRLTQPEQEVHGSGLGLALCRKIMKLHDGDIQVASSGPEGTLFALTFLEPPQ
jgi:signal transduction histidine kinase